MGLLSIDRKGVGQLQVLRIETGSKDKGWVFPHQPSPGSRINCTELEPWGGGWLPSACMHDLERIIMSNMQKTMFAQIALPCQFRHHSDRSRWIPFGNANAMPFDTRNSFLKCRRERDAFFHILQKKWRACNQQNIYLFTKVHLSSIAMDGVMMMILCCCCWRREAIFHLLSFALQIVVTHFAHAPNGTLFIETKGRMTCQLNNTRKLCIVMHLAKSEWAWLLRVSWGEGMGDGDYIPRQSAS